MASHHVRETRRLPIGLIDAVGEHFPMYQLYARGVMFGQLFRGVAAADMLVFDK